MSNQTAAQRAAAKAAAESDAAKEDAAKVVSWPSDVETMLADADREPEDDEIEGAGEEPAPKEGKADKSGMPDSGKAPQTTAPAPKPIELTADEKLAEAYRLMREAGIDPEVIMNGGAAAAVELAEGADPWLSADYLGRVK